MQEFQYGLKLSGKIAKREVDVSLFFSFPSLLQMPSKAKKYRDLHVWGGLGQKEEWGNIGRKETPQNLG